MKNFENINELAIYGLSSWKKEWLLLLQTMASDSLKISYSKYIYIYKLHSCMHSCIGLICMKYCELNSNNILWAI